MTQRKIALTLLAATLMAGSVASASLARPHGGRPDRDAAPIRPEIAFVHLLKVADTNKDGKISKEEFAARQEALFAEIDTNKDGSITPKEIRAFRQAKMEAFRAAHPRPAKDGAEGRDSERHGKRHDREGGRDMDRHGGGFRLMPMADTDGNGQVSKAEFIAAGEKLFQRLDRNKDSVISIDDMPDRPFL